MFDVDNGNVEILVRQYSRNLSLEMRIVNISCLFTVQRRVYLRFDLCNGVFLIFVVISAVKDVTFF